MTDVTPNAVEQLLDELGCAPNLHGGRCVGRGDEWVLRTGPTRDAMARRAVRNCRRCPVLNDCRAWLDGLPKYRRPHGTVTAARILPPRRGR